MIRREHGLAWGWLMLMVVTLMAFALAYAVLDGAVSSMFDISIQETRSPQIAQGRGYAEFAWSFAPVIVLFAAGLALLGRAIWESAQPGR